MNRAAFMLYGIFFAWPLWSFRHSISVSGLLIFGGFVFCSLLGFGYSFVRNPRSRWVLAALGLLIPVAFWTSMCLLVFRRSAWWEWLCVLPVWLGIPATLAVSLFTDQKTREYFAAKPTESGCGEV